MTETCPECGSEMKNGGPSLSSMGDPMYGRGLDEYYCDNPRCPNWKPFKDECSFCKSPNLEYGPMEPVDEQITL